MKTVLVCDRDRVIARIDRAGGQQGRTFHTLDRRLALAAQREGFVVPT
jgi:hypothetical protein